MEGRFNRTKSAQDAQSVQADALVRIAEALERLADKFAPLPKEKPDGKGT